MLELQQQRLQLQLQQHQAVVTVSSPSSTAVDKVTAAPQLTETTRGVPPQWTLGVTWWSGNTALIPPVQVLRETQKKCLFTLTMQLETAVSSFV